MRGLRRLISLLFRHFLPLYCSVKPSRCATRGYNRLGWTAIGQQRHHDHDQCRWLTQSLKHRACLRAKRLSTALAQIAGAHLSMADDITLPDFSSCHASQIRAKYLRSIHLLCCFHILQITDRCLFSPSSRTLAHLLAGSYRGQNLLTFRVIYQVMTHLRPGLVQCYDRLDFPRTNNDMERTIRAIKMHYRRMSGRKNWNSYLLRYGRCVAYQEWWLHQPNGATQLQARFQQIASKKHWRQVRQQTRFSHREQLNRYRFRHQPLAYLAQLEAQWEQTVCT